MSLFPKKSAFVQLEQNSAFVQLEQNSNSTQMVQQGLSESQIIVRKLLGNWKFDSTSKIMKREFGLLDRQQQKPGSDKIRRSGGELLHNGSILDGTEYVRS